MKVNKKGLIVKKFKPTGVVRKVRYMDYYIDRLSGVLKIWVEIYDSVDAHEICKEVC